VVPHDRPLGRDLSHLDSHQETHRVEECRKIGSGPRLDVEPGRLTIVDDPEMMLDMTVRREEEPLGRVPRRQAGDVLRDQ
jgi:hypothetical protein